MGQRRIINNEEFDCLSKEANYDACYQEYLLSLNNQIFYDPTKYFFVTLTSNLGNYCRDDLTLKTATIGLRPT